MMILGYEFTNPSTEELNVRRRLLDIAGYQAFVVPLIFLAGVRLLNQIWGRGPFGERDDASPQSQTHQRDQRHLQLSPLRHAARRAHWILTTTYFPEFGPLYVQVLGVVYVLTLAYIIVAPTKTDYLHLTKACGHVAVSQLPLLYLLSLKSPTLSPITWMTRLTHERLNAVHRLVGRVVHALLTCHVLLYLNFFLAKGILWKRSDDLDVITGMTAFAALNTLAVTALSAVRQKWYHVGFYRLHVIVSAAVVPVLWFHVPYTRIYVALAGVLWVLSGVSRRFGGALGYSTDVIVTSNNVGKGIIEVIARIDTEDNAAKERWTKEWWPGMHGYLNQSGLGPKAPFTIVSVQQEQAGTKDVAVRMMVRNLNGPTTGLLATLAKGEKKLKLNLEGPYGESKEYIPRLLQSDTTRGHARDTLIVAGGIGATYSLPIYTALAKSRYKDRTTAGRLKFIWIVKQIAEIRWSFDMLKAIKQPVDVDIFITTPSETKVEDDDNDNNRHGIKGLNIMRGGDNHDPRPNLRNQVERFFLSPRQGVEDNHSNRAAPSPASVPATVSVMVCGPPGLSRSLRKEMGRYVYDYGTDIGWYEEQFGFGGS